MDDRQAAVGDALSAAIRRAAQALACDDLAGAWQALDNPAVARALRDWDRLRGRPVPTESELQGEQATLIDQLRQSIAGQ